MIYNRVFLGADIYHRQTDAILSLEELEWARLSRVANIWLRMYSSEISEYVSIIMANVSGNGDAYVEWNPDQLLIFILHS